MGGPPTHAYFPPSNGTSTLTYWLFVFIRLLFYFYYYYDDDDEQKIKMLKIIFVCTHVKATSQRQKTLLKSK